MTGANRTRPVSAWTHYSHCPPERLSGTAAVVFDVLRASTTIVHALGAGASEVAVFGQAQEAMEACRRRVHAGTARQRIVLGGERGGVRIEGFDLGNSPREFTPETVSGRSVLFTTTNGTAAAWHVRDAADVFIGCFANLSAVVDAVVRAQRPVHLVCAGVLGGAGYEDALCAGAAADRLETFGWEPDDAALLMRAAWRGIGPEPGRLARELERGTGGTNVIRLGLGADIPICARVDSHACVPRLERAGMRFLAGEG